MSVNDYIKARRAMVIIVDECSVSAAKLAAQLEQYHIGLIQAKNAFECSRFIESRGNSKSTIRSALVKNILMMAMTTSECEWDIPKGYGDWRDFIQNPARPGRQTKKQKPPKQSFKAQMRSVNRNR